MRVRKSVVLQWFGDGGEQMCCTMQVAINWCIAQGTIPIPGAKTLKNAKDNIGSLGWSLKQAEMDELNSLADKVPQAMIQNVFQTS